MPYTDFSLYLGLYELEFIQTPEYATLTTYMPLGIPQDTRLCGISQEPHAFLRDRMHRHCTHPSWGMSMHYFAGLRQGVEILWALWAWQISWGITLHFFEVCPSWAWQISYICMQSPSTYPYTWGMQWCNLSPIKPLTLTSESSTLALTSLRWPVGWAECGARSTCASWAALFLKVWRHFVP